jgi:hypothetical protein
LLGGVGPDVAADEGVVVFELREAGHVRSRDA